MTVTIRDTDGAGRFEAWSDGALAGFAEYLRSDGLVVYPHTVVEPAYEGQGVGGALARAALDDARARGSRSWRRARSSRGGCSGIPSTSTWRTRTAAG